MYKCRQLKQNNLNKGFSLIEVLVAITLSLLILGALDGVYIVSHKLYVKSAAKAELNQNGRISLERITRDLRQATDIATELPLDNTNPPSSIMFQDGNNTNRIQYIKYSLVGSELHRELIHYCFASSPNPCPTSEWVVWNATDAFNIPASPATDEDMVKANKVTDLKFYGDTTVTIEITVTDNQNNSTNFQTEVYCRNI